MKYKVKKCLFMLIFFSLICPNLACHNEKEDMEKGNGAGIYTLDGKLVISYGKLENAYNIDITKDLPKGAKSPVIEVLSDLKIHEKVCFVLPNITKIGDYQFSYIQEIEQIRLPETLEMIGSYAFYHSGLRQVEFPSSVIQIKNNAFDGCKELANLKFNNGIRIIGVSAFRDTSSLKEILIPESVEEIHASAFANTGLSYVYIPKSVQILDDSAFLQTETVCYDGDVFSLDNFGAKRNHEFSDCNECDICGKRLEYVPYTITYAEFIAEDGMCDIPSSFTKNNVSYEVVDIASNAYTGNQDIIGLALPKTIQRIGAGAFKDCNNLKEVVLNESLCELGQGAFVNCTSIERIEIPKNITSLGNSFNGCSKLKEIILPQGISLSQNDFACCDNLETVYYMGTAREWENIYVEAPAPIMQTTIDKVFDENINIITNEQ